MSTNKDALVIHFVDRHSHLYPLGPVTALHIFRELRGPADAGLGIITRPDDPADTWPDLWHQVARRIVVRDDKDQTVACIKDPDGETWDHRPGGKLKKFDPARFDALIEPPLQYMRDTFVRDPGLYGLHMVYCIKQDGTIQSLLPEVQRVADDGNSELPLVPRREDPAVAVGDLVISSAHIVGQVPGVLIERVEVVRQDGVSSVHFKLDPSIDKPQHLRMDNASVTIDTQHCMTVRLDALPANDPDVVPGVALLREERDRYIDMYTALGSKLSGLLGEASPGSVQIIIEGVDYTDLIEGASGPTDKMLQVLRQSVEQEYDRVCREIYQLATGEVLGIGTNLVIPSIQAVVATRKRLASAADKKE